MAAAAPPWAAIDAQFAREPLAVFARIADVALAYCKVRFASNRGEILRAELSRLGPVFCKVGQTLATRPDLVGMEARDQLSRDLALLQDAVAPESCGRQHAMATLAAAFGGDIGANVTEITEAPVAAASLAEVYRAKSAAGGVAVAVKIQRPGLERKISLDLFVVRRLFILAHEHWQIAGFPTAMAIIDEVGASLFGELDFVREGRQQEHFRTVYGSQLHRLGVHVPRVLHELTSTRVLVTEWVEGVRPRELSARRRQALARTAVECLAMQLMGEGFVHCDPHEGNWLGLADGRVALLDFGLMAQMQMNHQEAMAHFAIHLVGSNYGALEEVLRQMGVLDESHADLRRPGVEEPFGVALTRALTGRGSVDGGGDGGGGASGARGVRRTFSELYEELSGLAFRYYFALPAYYLLVMRAFVTLEGIALSADADGTFNMYEVTAPYAMRKLLSPRTVAGRALLRAALLSPAGLNALRAGLGWGLPEPIHKVAAAGNAAVSALTKPLAAAVRMSGAVLARSVS